MANYEMVGREVKVNRGGPDTITGKLLEIGSDFYVVHSYNNNNNNNKNNNGDNNGGNNNNNQGNAVIMYVNARHVKSLSDSGESNYSYDETPEHITGSNFKSILQKLKHEFVQINSNGPEKVAGFITECTDNSLLLVVNNEVVQIPLFHIKSASIYDRSNNNNNKNNNNNNNEKNKDNNKSERKDNRSSKHNSSGRSHSSNHSHSSGRSSSKRDRSSKFSRSRRSRKTSSRRRKTNARSKSTAKRR